MKNLLFFVLFVPGIIQAQHHLEKFVDSLMAPLNRPDMPGSILLVAQDGKPIITKAYGMANLELSVPAKPEHLFTLASVSKQMISVAMLQLARQGKLNLSDDIRKHLPEFNTHGKVVTIEQLLTHTSGLYSETVATGARGKTFYDLSTSLGMLSTDEFIKYATQYDLFFEPGTDWGWNGFGFYVAFFIIEKVSGMPFNEYIRKNLFEPAGMTKSFSKVDGNRLGLFGTKDLVGNFYQPDADGKWVWRDFRSFTPMVFYQRYAIATCMDDLLKWDIALRKEKLLPKEWLEKAWTAYPLKDGRSTNCGLGWAVTQYNGFRVLAQPGIGTNPLCVIHVPERKLYLAYTQFYGVLEQSESILKKILSRLVPIPYPSQAKSQAPLTDYTGVYDIYRIGLRTTPQLSDIPVYLNVTTHGDTLYIQQTGTEKTWLRPAGKDKFLPARSESMWYIFKRDENGKVNAVTTQGTFWTYGPEILNKKVNVIWPKPVEAKSIDASLLEKYVGTYYLPSLDFYRFIETDGKKLYNKSQGRREELIPIASNKFVRKGIEDMIFEFKTDARGLNILTVNSLRAVDFRKVD
jgi:CubicO group peptidase (beta-lactamase class C family)